MFLSRTHASEPEKMCERRSVPQCLNVICAKFQVNQSINERERTKPKNLTKFRSDSKSDRNRPKWPILGSRTPDFVKLSYMAGKHQKVILVRARQFLRFYSTSELTYKKVLKTTHIDREDDIVAQRPENWISASRSPFWLIL